uniref:Autophagy protein 5 n=1 Tax=Artemia parthenogenetica TaxID=6663 RepID=A0A0F7LXR0_ARTPA|nr:autophagy protein 5 [Artemia parthenogenetica]
MAEDREALRRLRDAKIAACLTLASEEVTTPTKPESVYLMLPPMSYFPLVTEKVRRTFLHFVDTEFHNADMWFDCEGTPLKWHYPIGVLYDLVRNEDQLPWAITVHFGSVPKEIIHCPSKETVESFWVNCLKEADLLKHRLNYKVNCMQKRDLTQMFSGILHDKFDQFWTINKKLMESTPEGFKFIPFRLYTPDRGDKPFIQFQMKPYNSEGVVNTLKNLLDECDPKLARDFKVVLHGIFIPQEMPLQWLSEHMSYADSFLHIVLMPV